MIWFNEWILERWKRVTKRSNKFYIQKFQQTEHNAGKFFLIFLFELGLVGIYTLSNKVFHKLFNFYLMKENSLI